MPGAGRSASRPRRRSPSRRPTIHSSTREFSPNPGQRNEPSAPLRNQFTWKIFGAFVAEDAAHLDPVAPVVGHVVAAEREHREGVAAKLADGALGRRGLLRRDRRAHEDAVLPAARLGDERHVRGTPAAEEDRVDRHAVVRVPVVGDLRALGGGDREARVGVRGRPTGVGRPGLPSQSVSSVGGWSVSPSHQTSPSGRSATFVKIVLPHSVCTAVGFVDSPVPGATPKKPASGLIA